MPAERSSQSPLNPPKGVPPELSPEIAVQWVRRRVSEKRFRHIAGVAQTARKLAQKAGCDVFLAELAAWLHDACKQVKDKDLVAMARRFGLPVSSVEEEYGHLLHGPVAACVVRQELGVTNQELLDAISEHTLGSNTMSTLSKVVFLADCLEPGRPKEYTRPIWKALDIKGALDLDAAIVVACDLNLTYLVGDRKPVHPRTLEVRDHFRALVTDRNKQKE